MFLIWNQTIAKHFSLKHLISAMATSNPFPCLVISKFKNLSRWKHSMKMNCYKDKFNIFAIKSIPWNPSKKQNALTKSTPLQKRFTKNVRRHLAQVQVRLNSYMKIANFFIPSRIIAKVSLQSIKFRIGLQERSLKELELRWMLTKMSLIQ